MDELNDDKRSMTVFRWLKRSSMILKKGKDLMKYSVCFHNLQSKDEMGFAVPNE